MGNESEMQYIMDGNGNYYTLGGDGQLIVAKDRDEAAVFTFSEANEKIGEGKKSKFYHVIPVEEMEQTEKEMLEDSDEIAIEDCTDETVSKVFGIVDKMLIPTEEQTGVTESSVPTKPQPDFQYNIKDTDWNEFVNYYIFLASNIKGYLEELKKLDTQKYHPRLLPELFVGMRERTTDRDAYRQRRHMKLEEEATNEGVTQENMEEPEMSYAETVYDHKETDWLGFARQQMEFYRNAGQYMMNLQIEIDTIDQEIEDVMEKIEDANYNVAQGYKVFKELKDLRNERKSKSQELEVLRTMTECFDLDATADAWDYNVREIENITVGQGNEVENGEDEKEIAV